jgi:hypothetical protein
MKRMNEQSWETLTVAQNQPMAELLQQKLKAAKIPAVLVPGSDVSAYLGASSPYQVKVPAAKLAEAQEVVRD